MKRIFISIFFFFSLYSAEPKLSSYTYLDLLPPDVLTMVSAHLGQPSPDNDDCNDFFIQTSKVMRTFTHYIESHCNITQKRNIANTVAFLKSQVEYANLYKPLIVSTTYQNNELSAALALRTSAALHFLQKINEKHDSILTQLDTTDKNKLLVLSISVFPSVPLVEKLLQKGAMIDCRNDAQFTPLCLAVQKGSYELVEFLLKNNATVHVKDALGISCLMYASLLGKTAIARRLLDYGAAVNDADEFGHTALAWAAQKNNEDIVDLLLANNAHIHSKEVTNNAISAAVRGGNYAILKKCLHKKVFNLPEKQQRAAIVSSALEEAVLNKDEIALEIVHNYAKENGLEKDIYLPIFSAVRVKFIPLALKLLDWQAPYLAGKHVDIQARSAALALAIKRILSVTDAQQVSDYKRIVDTILQQGDLDPLYPYPKSAGYYAAKGENHELLQLLLQKSSSKYPAEELLCAAIESQSHRAVKTLVKFPLTKAYKPINDLTPLAKAIDSGLIAICHTLIDADFDIHEKDAYQQTFLHTLLKMPFRRKRIPIVHQLCQAGAQINAQDNAGNTPLMLAVLTVDDKSVVEYLLQKGADVHIANKSKATVLHWALKNHTPKIRKSLLELLIAAGADGKQADDQGNTPLMNAIGMQSNQELIPYLLQKKICDVQQANNKKDTPLIVACKFSSPDIIRCLLEHGADPNKKNKSGCGALTKAASRGSATLIALLLSYGAQLDIFKNSMLRAAASNGHKDIVTFLLKAGADINSISSSYGNTALHKAVQKKYPNVIDLLLRNGANTTITNARGETALEIAYHLNDNSAVTLILDYA